ncbi:hypothetical protein E2C01_084504 [Portunus trituberculatus]|uniref:Uncharacterized protein n=1 Tax=Portunus trituberculatus TaxID=210409 RepID=A0A5B7IVH4_PORTR|nr:hypothetical protein [Portunus trituberculatus]
MHCCHSALDDIGLDAEWNPTLHPMRKSPKKHRQFRAEGPQSLVYSLLPNRSVLPASLDQRKVASILFKDTLVSSSHA